MAPDQLDKQAPRIPDVVADTRVKEFVEFFAQFDRVPVDYDEAAINKFFDGRDALPEGSAERLAVAYKIFDAAFGGHRE